MMEICWQKKTEAEETLEPIKEETIRIVEPSKYLNGSFLVYNANEQRAQMLLLIKYVKVRKKNKECKWTMMEICLQKKTEMKETLRPWKEEPIQAAEPSKYLTVSFLVYNANEQRVQMLLLMKNVNAIKQTKSANERTVVFVHIFLIIYFFSLILFFNHLLITPRPSGRIRFFVRRTCD